MLLPLMAYSSTEIYDEEITGTLMTNVQLYDSEEHEVLFIPEGLSTNKILFQVTMSNKYIYKITTGSQNLIVEHHIYNENDEEWDTYVYDLGTFNEALQEEILDKKFSVIWSPGKIQFNSTLDTLPKKIYDTDQEESGSVVNLLCMYVNEGKLTMWDGRVDSIKDDVDSEQSEFSYIMSFKNYLEMDNQRSKIQEFFLGDFPASWTNDIWYNKFLVRILDNRGRKVKGRLFPVPSDNYAQSGFTIFNEYKTVTERCGWEINTNNYLILEYYTHLKTEGYVDDDIYWVFQPEDENYPVAIIKIDLAKMRLEIADKTSDLSTWEEPLAFIGEEYYIEYKIRNTDNKFNQYRNSEKSVFDEAFLLAIEEDIYHGDTQKKYWDMSPRFYEFQQNLRERVPFAYIMIFFDTFALIGQNYGEQQLIITFETSKIMTGFTDIQINMTNHQLINSALEKIRTYSSWVLYAGLLLFFYNEARQFLGQSKIKSDE